MAFGLWIWNEEYGLTAPFWQPSGAFLVSFLKLLQGFLPPQQGEFCRGVRGFANWCRQGKGKAQISQCTRLSAWCRKPDPAQIASTCRASPSHLRSTLWDIPRKRQKLKVPEVWKCWNLTLRPHRRGKKRLKKVEKKGNAEIAKDEKCSSFLPLLNP